MLPVTLIFPRVFGNLINMPRKKTTSLKTESPETVHVKQLYRSKKNKILGGVAGGLGEYFGVDPVVFRTLFILFTIFGGWGILVYFILWFIIPPEGHNSAINEDSMHASFEEMKSQVKNLTENVKGKTQSNRGASFWLALLFIFLGVLFFVDNGGLLRTIEAGKIWPLGLLLLGIAILMK